MKTPFCAVAINDVSQMTFTHVLRPGDAKPQEFTFALHEFNAEGLDDACLRVGRMIFAVMTVWYPEELARFPHLKMPFSAQHELNVISALITNSITNRTTAHIASIQILVDQIIQLDPTATEQNTIKKWPETKAMLEGLADFERQRKLLAR